MLLIDDTNYVCYPRLHLPACSKNPINEFCDQTPNTQDPSNLLKLNGYPLWVIYNRVPKSASEMIRILFRDQAQQQNFLMNNKEVFVPFRLTPDAQREVINEIYLTKTPVLYERHMYFIDFNIHRQPQPIYINIIRDPLQRAISEYYWSRKICRYEKRCYFKMKYLHETLDECVVRRPASECVSVSQGVNSIIPFFCGHDAHCENGTQLALDDAKHNIVKYYATVGIVEEMYNFFFVLEHLLPRYFSNLRLTYMAGGRGREERKTHTTGERQEPTNSTKILLREALSKEYELYNFVKERFHSQFRQILQTTI